MVGKFMLGDSETMEHMGYLTNKHPEALLFTILNLNEAKTNILRSS